MHLRMSYFICLMIRRPPGSTRPNPPFPSTTRCRSGASLRAVRPSPDGRFVADLKGRDDDAQRRDLWLVGRDGRHARMLVDTERLGSGAALSEAEKMRRERARLGGSSGLVDYSWSSDGSFVAFALDGDVYTVTLDGKRSEEHTV